MDQILIRRANSDSEVMRYCQMLHDRIIKSILVQILDVPAGDIGVGGREIGYLFGQYKRLREYDMGVLTGKPLGFNGSLGRTEATGYGAVYFVKHLLEDRKDSFDGKKSDCLR